jgi:hypothetical protein
MIGGVRRPILGLAMAVGAMLAIPAAACGATRYASSNGGTVPGCPLMTPCSLEYAITAAEAGDTIQIGLDHYEVSANIVASVPLTIEGLTPPPLGVRGERQPPARIVGAPGVTPLESEKRLTVRKLAIESTEPDLASLAVFGEGSVFDHLILRASGSSGVVALRPGSNFVLTDSLLVGSGASSGGLFVQGAEAGTSELRNDTIVASGTGSVALGLFTTKPGATVVVRGVNVIANGATDVSSGATPGAVGTIALDHSNWDTSQGAVTGTAIQTIPPVFMDQTFHEAESSPTVDAGVNDPANGVTDLDGNPRALSAHPSCGTGDVPITDIGAYELQAPAPSCAPPRPRRPGTRITKVRIDRRMGRARFRFRAIGKATGFECALIRKSPKRRRRPRFGRCRSPKTYRRLEAGHYLFEVRAVNRGRPDLTPAKRRFAL